MARSNSKKAPAHMEIVMMPLKGMTESPYNPRTISKEALEGLKASIGRFGVVEPIVWNKRSKRVVGGHQRLKAMQALGYDQVQVCVVDLDDTDEKALNIALNNPKIAGEFTTGLEALLGEIKTAAPAV